jgi:hypothetical protein
MRENKLYDSVSYSISFRKERWEEIKNNPELLNESLVLMMGNVVSTDWLTTSEKRMMPVFDKFEVTERELCYHFHFYNLDSKEHEELYRSKLSEEDRKQYDKLGTTGEF